MIRVGRLAATIIIVIAAGLAVASCGGGDSGEDPPDNGASPPPTGATTSEVSEGTPLPFDAQRDELAERLDAIGANVGAVPPDVRQELLILCGNLVDLAERETVQQICNGLNQAFLNDDPDLLDLVVRELRNLEAT